MASGILPITIIKCKCQYKIMLLMGQERYVPGWRDSLKWSDFGGAKDPGETSFQAAVREFQEETMGFMFNNNEVAADWVKRNCIAVISVNGNLSSRGRLRDGLGNKSEYTMYIVNTQFDPYLVNNYNSMMDWLYSQTDSKLSEVLTDSSYFEKRRILWVDINDVSQFDCRTNFRKAVEHLKKIL